MSFALEETLEADWVAVRPHVFDEREKHKFVFIVAWNEVEGKFAITCHNRTAQRQRSGSREQAAGGTASDGARGQGGAAARARPAAPLRSPGPRRGAAWPEAGPRGAPASTVRVVGAPGAAAEEIEVLELVRDDEADAAPPPAAEPEPAAEECSWAGLFSFQDLRAVHQQLCSVNSQLEPCLPVFPEEPSGMWTVLFGGAPEMSEQEVDALCYQLQVYLGHGLDTCGWKILSQVLFTESDDPEEYYESLSELRQKGYEEVLQRARKRIQELLDKHKNTESMVELLDLYQREDEAYSSLAEATTELYQYLLQPFRDMRELAMLRRQQIKISMENDYLGPRRIESLQKEDADWQRKAHMAVLSIQDLTVKYFEITAKAQKAVYDRMRADQKKFGKASWAAAAERMEKLQYAVSKETLQMMRAKEICLEQRKRALKEEMQSLQGGPEAIARLDQLEADYYDLQLQLYEVQFEILKCEELLLTAQLESIKRLISEKRDEVVYYDTYESMEAMLEKEDLRGQREELQKLQQKARQLEARRGRVCAKKAYLRNKKEICIAKHNEKLQQRFRGEDEYAAHHAVQLKREKLHDEEERKSAWVSQERQRTLDRLRSFKQKYPGQVTLKSTRLRLAHAHRRGTPSTGLREDTGTPGPAGTAEERAGTSAQPPSLPDAPPAPLEATSLPLSTATSTSEPPPALSLPLLDGGPQPPPSARDPLPPPLPPTPPPPPPPPPLPLARDSTPGPPEEGLPTREQPGERGPRPTSAPSAHLLDSSQLLSARRKLRKTAEGSPRRRVAADREGSLSPPFPGEVSELAHGRGAGLAEARQLPPAEGGAAAHGAIPRQGRRQQHPGADPQRGEAEEGAGGRAAGALHAAARRRPPDAQHPRGPEEDQRGVPRVGGRGGGPARHRLGELTGDLTKKGRYSQVKVCSDSSGKEVCVPSSWLGLPELQRALSWAENKTHARLVSAQQRKALDAPHLPLRPHPAPGAHWVVSRIGTTGGPGHTRPLPRRLRAAAALPGERTGTPVKLQQTQTCVPHAWRVLRGPQSPLCKLLKYRKFHPFHSSL